MDYAVEAMKQGSATVGLKSATHAVIVALKVGLHLYLQRQVSYSIAEGTERALLAPEEDLRD